MNVLVSDFDGTMTRHDFYKLAIERLLPPDVPDYWAKYRAGRITHFEALKSYFAAISAREEVVINVIEAMELDPGLADAIVRLRKANWKVVVVSAGCDWYIRHLLEAGGVDVEVYANPGRFQEGQGLVMELPYSSPEFSATLGIDKEKIVRRYLHQTPVVAFAGDGFPDAAPARLVPDPLRFARGDLAEVLTQESLPFRRFEAWSDIVEMLVPGEA